MQMQTSVFAAMLLLLEVVTIVEVRGCDMDTSRKLINLCSRARKRSAGPALHSPPKSEQRAEYSHTPLTDRGDTLPNTSQDVTYSLTKRLSRPDVWSRAFPEFFRLPRRQRRSVVIQQLLDTCCTMGCSFDELRSICMG